MSEHSDKSDSMFTVTVKRLIVQRATVYVRAKNVEEAGSDAMKQAESGHLDFDDSTFLDMEIEEVIRA